ncbi:MAG: hypothetical protein M3Y31_07915 [Gemmatimonadota bacterium]|jgi:TctA family transporter|nr:hypothetical protein [Gemmatimonadota bacterium]
MSLLYYFGMVMAGVGAAAILFALAFVSAVVGGLVNAMIVLMCGPLIDKYLVKRGARQEARPVEATAS